MKCHSSSKNVTCKLSAYLSTTDCQNGVNSFLKVRDSCLETKQFPCPLWPIWKDLRHTPSCWAYTTVAYSRTSLPRWNTKLVENLECGDFRESARFRQCTVFFFHSWRRKKTSLAEQQKRQLLKHFNENLPLFLTDFEYHLTKLNINQPCSTKSKLKLHQAQSFLILQVLPEPPVDWKRMKCNV